MFYPLGLLGSLVGADPHLVGALAYFEAFEPEPEAEPQPDNQPTAIVQLPSRQLAASQDGAMKPAQRMALSDARTRDPPRLAATAAAIPKEQPP